MSLYRIRPGDTLTRIANQFGVSVTSLARDNRITQPNRILEGAYLKVPDTFTPAQQAAQRSNSTPAMQAQQGSSSFTPAPAPATGPNATNNSAASVVSLADLKEIMPRLPDAKAQQYLPYLQSAMKSAGINTTRRQAAFLSEIAHESGELTQMTELASGRQYEGRTDLGNTQPGDGVRFKGRGPIQLTGRENYKKAGDALGIDLVGHPELAANPQYAFKIAAWFWSAHHLNDTADSGDLRGVRMAVNGSLSGYNDTRDYFDDAEGALVT